jgi:hypothetical protein
MTNNIKLSVREIRRIEKVVEDQVRTFETHKNPVGYLKTQRNPKKPIMIMIVIVIMIMI